MSEEQKFTTMKMRYSFNGAFRNAKEAIEEIQDTANDLFENEEIDEDGHSAIMNQVGSIDSALCLYHDTILGLLKGEVTHEEARDFLCLEGDVLTNTKYVASVVTIKAK